MAGAAADDALAAERPDPGFCGDTGATVERRVGRLLARMTLAEKLDQMHGVSVFTPGLAGRIAGVARLRIPGIGMIDGARGVGAVSGTATCFPVGMARGAMSGGEHRRAPLYSETVLLSIKPRIPAMNCSSGCAPWSPCLRLRTATWPLACSRSPITNM